MTVDKYTLVGKCAVLCLDLLAWGRWMEENQGNRHVAEDYLEAMHDGGLVVIRISTAFLGIDLNWLGRGDPLLWETMIFGGPNNGDQWRYATWDEAERGHARTLMCERLWLSDSKLIKT
jgi:hypothetical protein